MTVDIKVGNTYLEHDNPFYAQVIKALGMEEVPKLPDMTPNEAIEFVKSKPKSRISADAPMEGVVLRPKVRLYGPNGSRLIVKVKCKDYEPYNEIADKYQWVKQGGAVVLHEEMMDVENGSRVMVVKPHRCTVTKIYTESGKIEGAETLVELRGIDTGMVIKTIPAYLTRYNKEEWKQ